LIIIQKNDLIKVFTIKHEQFRLKFPTRSFFCYTYLIPKLLCEIDAADDIKEWFTYNGSTAKKEQWDKMWQEI